MMKGHSKNIFTYLMRVSKSESDIESSPSCKCSHYCIAPRIYKKDA